MENILSWGKPTIEIGKLGTDGSAPTSWITVDTPVMDSAELSVEKGDKKEAKISGGDIIATRYTASNYTFSFELYAKKGSSKPVEDVDGVVADLYAIRITPENTSLPGKLLDCVSLNCEETWTEEDGEKWKYTADVLKPSSGNKVKSYTATTEE